MTSSKKHSNGLVELVAGLSLGAVLFAGPSAGPSVASEVDFSGFLAVEGRGFLDEPAFPGQESGGQLSLQLAPELVVTSADRRHQLTLSPYLRLDQRDDERTHFDLREAYYRYVGSDWQIVAGANRVFWGVTESRHLVDVINQDDAVEDIDGEDKLGQPMVELTLIRSWGTLGLYVLPLFRERTAPGIDGRLRPALPVDTDAARYTSSAADRHVDTALRYSHSIGAWDLGVSYFDGTGREPRLLPNETLDRLVPVYDQIRQVGVDLQQTTGAWLFKLEGLVREGQGPRFGAYVAGFEHTRYQILSTAADLGLLVELLYDGRSKDPTVAPPTIYDDDVFLGARLGLNDVQDTSVLAGVVVDRHDGSAAVQLESERRFGSSWKLELEGRLFLDVDERNLLRSFRRDDVLTLRISRFF